MKKHHEVTRTKVVGGCLHMTVDGKQYIIDLAAVSPRLAAAGPDDLKRFDVSPSGYGIHWPTVDEDLSVDGMIRWSENRPRPTRRARQAIV